MDKLIVRGLDSLNGEYDCDVIGMLTIGNPESLTNRELHRVKSMSGVRGGELIDALAAGDNDLMVALAAVILTRKGKRYDEEKLWDAPAGSGLDLVIESRDGQEDGEVDVPPPVEPPLSEETTPLVGSGGSSTNQTSGLQVTGPSLTGPPASLRSVISSPETLAI